MDDTNLTPWGAVMSAAKDDADEPDTPAASAEEIAGPSPVLVQQITPEMVAGGYQLGAGSQQITVGGEGKGPKVPMIIAAVLVVVGLIGFAVGAVVGGSIEDTFNRLSTVDYTNQIGASGEITYKDADGAGEEGWYLLIPGDPKADENDNGIIDACEGINFTFTDADGDDASERIARVSCSTDIFDGDSNANEPYFDITDHVIVARVCHTIADDPGEREHRCVEGESFTVANDAGVNMSVVDLDAMYIETGFVEELLTKGAVSVVAFGAGCCSACGGLIALVVGLTRLGGGKPSQQVQFQIQ